MEKLNCFFIEGKESTKGLHKIHKLIFKYVSVVIN